jgi:tetratricopeptide (TPR) repeat protein
MTTTSIQTAMADLKDALARRDRAALNSTVQTLIGLDAPLGAQWQALAQAVQHNGEHTLAIACLSRWHAQSGWTPACSSALAATLARAGRIPEAAAVMDDMPAGQVNPAAWNYTRGTLSLNLGRTEEAKGLLRTSLNHDPGSGQAWLALAMAGPISDAEGAAMEATAARFSSGQDAEAGAFHYAMSRLLEQRGQKDEAFGVVERGAEIMRGLRKHDRSQDDALTESVIRDWSREAIDQISARLGSPEGKPPIFVTGLPRSGTTLVEQILASHSQVLGGEELSILRWPIQSLGGPSIGGITSAPAEQLREARALYLHLLAERFPGDGRVVDKTLALSRSMGFAATLFPDAPIIWLRRDPLDSAWSIYRTYFLRSVDWSWSQADIASFFRNEDRLSEHWTKILGDRILVVPYQELVEDPASWTDRITRFCGLEPEEAQRDFHRLDRAVTTASAMQVREPINRSGLGSAQKFATHLAPFLQAYAGKQ